MIRRPPRSTLFPTRRSSDLSVLVTVQAGQVVRTVGDPEHPFTRGFLCGKVNRYAERVHSPERMHALRDRKSTRLNSSHDQISYAVFCLKQKKDRAMTRASGH